MWCEARLHLKSEISQCRHVTLKRISLALVGNLQREQFLSLRSDLRIVKSDLRAQPTDSKE